MADKEVMEELRRLQKEAANAIQSIETHRTNMAQSRQDLRNATRNFNDLAERYGLDQRLTIDRSDPACWKIIEHRFPLEDLEVCG